MEKQPITLRVAEPQDGQELAGVYVASVRTGPSPYTPAQRTAWVPHPPDPVAFAARLAALYVGAAARKGHLVGFMAMDGDGYIDLAFILPEHRGGGIFAALCAAVEGKARAEGLKRLWTDAGLVAQPAFRARGFWAIQHTAVARAGQSLARAQMEKHLT